MKVLLPDQTELELPDGATGRDAAAAIGPKLAEQAVLVRSNGTSVELRARVNRKLLEGVVRVAEEHAGDLHPEVEVTKA